MSAGWVALFVFAVAPVRDGRGQGAPVAAVTAGRDATTARVTVQADHAPLASVLQEIVRQAALIPIYDATLIPTQARVTLHVSQMPVEVALQEVLRGTGLVARVHRSGNVVIARDEHAPLLVGVIVGKVVDARTKQPLRGVKIGLDNVEQAAETGEDGMYRIASVSAGSHTVSAKLLGYTRIVRTVTVTDGSMATVDVALESSAMPLDQVVVTGTVIPTELKAVPNAMTMITAKDIEERGITRMADLFRGDVPGMFVSNDGMNSGTMRAAFGASAMFTRGATALSSNSVGTDAIDGRAAITTTIKTYVDGVELAQPEDLYLVDPKSIERIEILTGPQASTIYGSNAINGVMQIFTKRGTSSAPQLTLSLQSGLVQNNLSSALSPRDNDNVQLSGVEGRLSYQGNVSWNYTGSWTPRIHATLRTGSGGVRLEMPTWAGRVTTDLSLRRTLAQNKAVGSNSQVVTSYQESGFYQKLPITSGVNAPILYNTAGQTIALTLGYMPTAWWSHEAMIGQDFSDLERRSPSKSYSKVSDTTLSISHGYSERRSLRYTTTVRTPVTSLASATLTAGADAWQSIGYNWYVTSTTTLFSDFSSSGINRNRDHNTGVFLQGQLGVVERLFLTYGVRAEFNPAIGDKATVLPGRYGMAYTQEFGSITAKVRGSYGRSIRPPGPTFKSGVLIEPNFDMASYLIPVYGKFYEQLPNPELVPEYQQGGEGGLELYLGSRGSLVITRYNQTVNGLIDNVSAADSVRSLLPNPMFGNQTCADVIAMFGRSTGLCSSQDANGYAYLPQSEYLNIGSIRNQGWELNGSLNLGPLTTRGTYSWTKSRVIGITPKYRALFTAEAYPQYQPGATFMYLPEHTWAWGATYHNATTTAGLNVHGTGQIAVTGNAFSIQNLSTGIRLPQQRLNFSAFFSFLSMNQNYALADINVSRRMSSRLDGTLQVQNLLNTYQNDVVASSPTAGRQTTLGLRLRL